MTDPVRKPGCAAVTCGPSRFDLAISVEGVATRRGQPHRSRATIHNVERQPFTT